MKSDPKRLNTFNWEIKPEADKDLHKETLDLFLESYLYGMASSAPLEEKEFADGITEVIAEPITFEAASEFLKGRVSLKRSDYYRLSDFMKTRAFTVGRLSQLDAIDRVRTHLLKQIEGSTSSLNEFIEAIEADELLQVAGFSSESPWYLETVYRTNTMTNYNAGRAQEFQESKPVALEFLGIEDSRQTAVCAERTGIILPASDPFWERNWPPLHFNCRSTIRAIYKEEADVLGLDISSITKESKKKLGGIADTSNGFGANPIKDNAMWRNTPEMSERINRYLIDEELNGVVGETVCKDFAKEVPGMVNIKTTKGGVRYPKEMANHQELTGNLKAATALAEGKGYYVELHSPGKEKYNKQFDAWVNAVEKWEFKELTSTKIKTISREINDAFNKAENLLLVITYRSQIKPLESAIEKRIIELSAGGRFVDQLSIQYKDKLLLLPWKVLQDKDALHETLTTFIN